MSTPISLNALLSLPKDFDKELKIGRLYTIQKSGYRILPFKMPMELSTSDHKYIGKIVVQEIKVKDDITEITFEVLKIFSEEESKVYSENFLRYD